MSINWAVFYEDFLLALHISTGVAEVASTVATGGAAGTVTAVANAAAIGNLITQSVQASVPSLSAANVAVNPQLQAVSNLLPILAQSIVAAKQATPPAA